MENKLNINKNTIKGLELENEQLKKENSRFEVFKEMKPEMEKKINEGYIKIEALTNDLK